jgi:DNA oxidative demethylase
VPAKATAQPSLFAADKPSLPDGVLYLPAALDRDQQQVLLTRLREIVAKEAPLFQPTMPRTGKPFSVEMTNCGSLGWVSDKARGYRYEPCHPVTGKPWPPIPEILLDLWRAHAQFPALPEACLVNWYATGTKMGSHVDRDEQEFDAPVLSVSLGDTAIFHIGGRDRADKKIRFDLESGDVLLFGGPSRLAYHGIDRVKPGTSDLIPGGGRINLTLRRVTKIA